MSFNLNFAVNLHAVANHTWNAARPVQVCTENGSKLLVALPVLHDNNQPGIRVVYDDAKSIELLYAGNGLWHEIATA